METGIIIKYTNNIRSFPNETIRWNVFLNKYTSLPFCKYFSLK